MEPGMWQLITIWLTWQTYCHMMSPTVDVDLAYMCFESLISRQQFFGSGNTLKKGIPEPNAQWPMVVKGLLEMRAPPILILTCLLTLWNTQLPHSVDICLTKIFFLCDDVGAIMSFHGIRSKIFGFHRTNTIKYFDFSMTTTYERV